MLEGKQDCNILVEDLTPKLVTYKSYGNHRKIMYIILAGKGYSTLNSRAVNVYFNKGSV